MMHVVIDTNVLLSALKSTRGASYELISQLPSKYFQPVLSVPLYSEYQDVLTRQHLLADISNEDILGFLRYICHISHRQEIFFLWRPWLKDAKDDMVLELAVASNCKYIVTYNLNDFKNIDKFAIEAITPAQFLKHLESLTNG